MKISKKDALEGFEFLIYLEEEERFFNVAYDEKEFWN